MTLSSQKTKYNQFIYPSPSCLPGADPGGGATPPKDAKVAFWSALPLIHSSWNSSNKLLNLKCTKIRLADPLKPGAYTLQITAVAAIEGSYF